MFWASEKHWHYVGFGKNISVTKTFEILFYDSVVWTYKLLCAYT